MNSNTERLVAQVILLQVIFFAVGNHVARIAREVAAESDFAHLEKFSVVANRQITFSYLTWQTVDR